MKTVFEIAREAGIKNDCDGIWCNADQLERFAELVRADEREACAKVCQEMSKQKLAYLPPTGVPANACHAPPAQRTWAGLTDWEISQLWIGTSPYFNEVDFARALEAKLKEKNT